MASRRKRLARSLRVDGIPRMRPGGRTWFIVLPDGRCGRSVAEGFRNHAPQLVEHASGRPWIVGQWAPDEMTVASAGRVRIAIIGCCPITATQLSALLAGVERIADVDRIVLELPGSFHLIASVKGQVRVQGSVSALRQVFYARVAGLVVAADNAQALVSLTGAAIDDRLIAPQLPYPQLPYPLDGQCLWRGVRNLSSDCCLILDDESGDHILQWWSARNLFYRWPKGLLPYVTL
jgi:asparagine synthase (glutamine-hydrolysing)